MTVEVDHLNGLISGLGQAAGVETPLNELIVRAVHSIEERNAESGPALLAEVSRGVSEQLARS